MADRPLPPEFADRAARIVTRLGGDGAGARDPDRRLRELGLDSVLLMEAIAHLERELGGELDEEQVSALVTIGDLAAALAGEAAARGR